ncbi:MAG: phosphatidylcholine/phosphatidylserine synthase [Alphaproteobacteria bacterium]|nr:phosphatidylcholine/phosphatidylserine synthase [Alphaproteobacteria bacterium]
MTDTNPQKQSKTASTELKDDGAFFTHFHKLIPNLLTLMALTAGLTGIQFAMNGEWEKAVLSIVVAAVLDMLDGATARLLNAASEFGAQLDSFSDFLAFGVAPSLILYLWVLEESGKLGWIAMLVFAVACAMRLARYNITPRPKTGAWSKGFFAGVPAPGGAGLVFLPMFIWFLDPGFFEQFAIVNTLVGLWVILCAGMMVSRIPTWSSKQIKLPANMAMPMLGFAVIIIAALIQAPWPTLTIICLIYITSIPFAVQHFRKIVKENKEEFDLAELALGVGDLDKEK